MTRNRNILEVEDLSLDLGKKRVLNGTNLRLSYGEVKALIGASGCGKTSLLKTINLLNRPHKGSISLNGQVYLMDGRLVYMPYQVRREVGLVFQDFNLFPNMTCLQNIVLSLIKVKGLTKNEAIKTAEKIADDLSIVDVLKKYPEMLSGGQAQRVSLARALVLKPKVLLLDEITSALDVVTAMSVVDSIRKIKEIHQELSIIVVTHQLHFAQEFSDNIAFMADGKIIEEYPSDKFVESCQDRRSKVLVDMMRASY